MSYDRASDKEVEFSGGCRRCKVDRTGGDYAVKQSVLPDFNQSEEEGMLVKGVKGIANFIPSMVNAISQSS